jgi:hypothetical protein
MLSGFASTYCYAATYFCLAHALAFWTNSSRACDSRLRGWHVFQLHGVFLLSPGCHKDLHEATLPSAGERLTPG